MCSLPKKCFCWSLKAGTVAQGVTCLVTASINILLVALGLGDLIEARIYKFCFPSESCFDELKALEESLVLANVAINALLFVLSPLLLHGVKQEKPSHLYPFMFVQGLMISGLFAASVTALVICIEAGYWFEYVPILVCSLLYLSLHIYFALVIFAYHSQLKREVSRLRRSICTLAYSTKEKEATLEDFVF